MIGCAPKSSETEHPGKGLKRRRFRPDDMPTNVLPGRMKTKMNELEVFRGFALAASVHGQC